VFDYNLTKGGDFNARDGQFDAIHGDEQDLFQIIA